MRRNADPNPETVAAAIDAVFPSHGDARRLPSSRLLGRGILYPTEDGLTEEQFVALSAAAAKLGEEIMYLGFIERVLRPDVAQEFEIGLLDFDRYLDVAPSGLDHALVSTNGIYGALVLHDGLAIVAGDDQFIQAVYRDLPTLESQVSGLVSEIRGMASSLADEWLHELLLDIFGRERADGFTAK